jgi:hypothetical protein
MLKCKTSICVFVLSVILFQGIVLAQAPTDDFVNTAIAQQTYAFVAEFNAKATADSVDGVLGLSKIEPAGYGDLNILMLFNNAGFITAKNGGSYEAVNDLPYTANTTYAFKQLVNIPAQTYSVWVTPEGDAEVLLAEDFAFSKTADTLNYRSVKMSFDTKWGGAVGMVEITDFTIKNSEDFVNVPVAPQGYAFVAEFNAMATADSVDGVLGLSEENPGSYGDFNSLILFNNQGFITVKDGKNYKSLVDFPYTANTTYAFKQLVNIPAQTHSVWVTPQNGGAAKQANGEILLAEDYSFSLECDSIKYRSVKMSIGGKWGGADGMVVVSDFEIKNSEDYVNVPIEPQTGAFVAEFNAKATADSVDGVLGLSQKKPGSYSDYNSLILFNNQGFITIKDGKNYKSLVDLAYTANTTYAFKQLVNIPAQTHSVWITPEGGAEVQLAADYAFSLEGDTINYRSVKMSIGGKWGGADGMVEVTDFTIKNPEDFINVPIEPQTGRFMAEFNAKATADSVDGVLGLSDIIPAAYSDMSILLLFNNSGFITAKNGGDYEAINDLPYTANTTYAFKQVVDIPNKTYSVWVTPQNGGAAKQAGAEVLLAEDFAFSKETDTLNYRNVKMSIGGKWGGADGIVEVTDFTISDAPSDKWSCIFIRTKYPERQYRDSSLIARMEKYYDLTPVADTLVTIDEMKKYDFCFVSESISDWVMAMLGPEFKAAPIPTFHGELWLAQPAIRGFVSADGLYGTISDSSGNGGKVTIIDGSHFLAAGFADGTEVTIASNTDEADEFGILSYCIPEIDHIPIAVSVDDPNKVVVMGVEEETPLWDDLGLAIDPNITNKNRIAAVGLYAMAHNYITEDGYKLIDAGIKWIMKDTIDTAVEPEVIQPVDYTLAQNFPNPFNPTTEILFSLKKAGHTTLTIYNIVGQKVETLVDRNMPMGQHQITFRAGNLPSGVYFYRLRSGDFTKVKKMMLMK